MPVPVVSTAFRPLDRDELATNPFRVFTSMLVPEDRRFFDAGLERRLRRFLDARELFPAELLSLADVAVEHGELPTEDADRYLELAVASFALSTEPVDRAWYTELERVSGVAADIGGVTSTHINHLTPRVLDIDDLYASMQARGIEMIDEIQGPPRWDGPGRAAAADLLPRARRAAHLPCVPTEGSRKAPCGCGSARSRRVASR